MVPHCHKCNIPFLDIPPSPKSSPIHPLLIANDPAEAYDEAIARQVIASCKHVVAHIDGLISQLNNLLDLIKSRREEYTHHIQLHENVLSKFARHVPADILSEIFLHAVNRPSIGSKQLPEEPWVVSQVSRRWRLVALSTPTIWSAFPAFRESLDKDKRYYSRLQTALGRSGAVPLNVSFYLFGIPEREVWKMADLFTPHSHRFNDLCISSNLHALQLFSSRMTGHLHALKSLALYFSHTQEPYRPPVSLPITSFLEVPSLRELTLGIWTRPQTTAQSWIALPWHQLRRLTLSCAALLPSSIISILRQTVALERCVLQYWHCDYTLSMEIPHFNSLSLIELHIGSEMRGVVEPFLCSLTFPSLRKLSISAHDVVDLQCLADFISRSSCSLTFLDLAWEGFSGDLKTLLSLVPCLTDLRIPGKEFLRIPSADRPSLPELRHVCIVLDHDAYAFPPSDSSTNPFTDTMLDLSSLETVTLSLPESFESEGDCQELLFRRLDGWSQPVYDSVLRRDQELQTLVNRSLTEAEASSLQEILSALEGIHGRYIHVSFFRYRQPRAAPIGS
ncbi:unnamed protein product [Cyclocybe aegerita]|uniref:F-box domain-containing protein n=1 Tax=Cyclocybe aegerita TaxID=1973307 RepID=A0A8S0XWS3_CYCAE|nr:unnamed protein product [Cyclocybe aegerita]